MKKLLLRLIGRDEALSLLRPEIDKRIDAEIEWRKEKAEVEKKLKTHYRPNLYCKNCHYWQSPWVKKGQQIDSAICPKCGCKKMDWR